MATIKPGSSAPAEDDYDYFAMRRLSVPSIQDFAAVIPPLKDFAESKGYRFQVSSPGGEPWSVMFNIETEAFDITGISRPDGPGLQFAVYWHADIADNPALDTIAEQLRQVLTQFGTVTITSAPAGERPREKSTNLWRRR